MNRKTLGAFVLFFLILGVSVSLKAETNVPRSKQTVLGLYITANDAYFKWYDNKERVKILDVRTPEEYSFVGHAPMAKNIPLRFLNQKRTIESLRPVMETNPSFIDMVKEEYKVTDTILVMCRSGGRSAAAVDLMAKAGFKNVYNIIDGFEGDPVKEPESYYTGKRVKNGWKNSGAPWTY